MKTAYRWNLKPSTSGKIIDKVLIKASGTIEEKITAYFHKKAKRRPNDI